MGGRNAQGEEARARIILDLLGGFFRQPYRCHGRFYAATSRNVPFDLHNWMRSHWIHFSLHRETLNTVWGREACWPVGRLALGFEVVSFEARIWLKLAKQAEQRVKGSLEELQKNVVRGGRAGVTGGIPVWYIRVGGFQSWTHGRCWLLRPADCVQKTHNL